MSNRKEPTDQELVEEFIAPVLSGDYSPEEWAEKTKGRVASARTIRRWSRGDFKRIEASTRRKLKDALGYERMSVPGNTEAPERK